MVHCMLVFLHIVGESGSFITGLVVGIIFAALLVTIIHFAGHKNYVML